MTTRNTAIAIVVIVFVVGIISVIELAKPERANVEGKAIALSGPERTAAKAQQYEPAKEISTPDAFINTEPFRLSDHIGTKVILVEFWTYSCINCQRVIPYLNAWHTKYEDDGLLVVGIHTPEFEFEKELENVQRAVDTFDIAWPVVLDNDYSTWSSYKNRYWPRKYLIDIDGFIVYDHIGEGAYDETEEKIVELLNERKQVLGEEGQVAVEEGAPSGVQEVDFQKVRTPETYLGAARIQYLVNLPNASCLSGSCTYSFSSMEDFEGYELSGAWKLDAETATLESETGALRIAFNASKVNVVAGAGEPVRARILVDGEVVSNGADVEDGIVTIDTHDLYNLVDLEGEYGEHVLEIQFLDPGVAAFAFTFG